MKKNNATTKRTTTSYISLPQTLIDDIMSLGLTSTQTSHAIKFIGILMRDSFQEQGDLTSLTGKPNTYIQKTFDEHYTKWMMPLLESGIILRSDSYSIKYGISYLYSLSSSYFNLSHTLSTEKVCEALPVVGYKDIIKTTLEGQQLTKIFTNDIEELRIDYNGLKDIVKDIIGKLSINDFRTNDQITEKVINLQLANGEMQFIGIDKAIERAKALGQSIIQDKNRYVIADEAEFIQRKKIAYGLSYNDSIDRLERGEYRANRNSTNRRLDTNITNMCSHIVENICNQNDLVQIDLANSQFTLLSHILTPELDTDDFRRFKALSVSGELYDYIKEELGLETRKQGKLNMFELMFSSRKNNTAGKAKLKTLFPSVIKWIDDYKKEHGDESFAIMLQLFESDLFIDNIYKTIKKKKMFCLTKHDSFIVKRKDLEAKKGIIED